MRVLQLLMIILQVSAGLAGRVGRSPGTLKFLFYGLDESDDIWGQIIRDFHKCICLDVVEMVLLLSLT